MKNGLFISVLFIMSILSSNLISMQSPSTQSDEYELFKATQKIVALVNQKIKQANSHNIRIYHDMKGYDEPNGHFHQTKQGLFLRTNQLPESLFTPWGELFISRWGGMLSSCGYLAVTQTILQHFAFQFDHIEYEFSKQRPDDVFYEISQQIPLDKADQIDPLSIVSALSSTQLEHKKGQQIFILPNSSSQSAVYKLFAVDGKSLPDPTLQPYKLYRTYREAIDSWQHCMKRFKFEKE